MMNNWYGYGPGYGGGWGYHMSGFGPGLEPWLFGLVAIAAPIVALLVLWSLAWKGLALWHAARRGQYWWFIILALVNTLGILEIIYLFFVAKIAWRDLFSLNSHGHAHH